MNRLGKDLAERGIALPRPWILPEGSPTTARLIVQRGDCIYLAGHLPTTDDGQVPTWSGKVGSGTEAGTSAGIGQEEAARFAVRAVLNALATLDAFLPERGISALQLARLDCLVNAAPSFTAFTAVMNPASQLLVDAFGAERGAHVRLACGVAGLPLNAPVEIAMTIHRQ